VSYSRAVCSNPGQVSQIYRNGGMKKENTKTSKVDRIVLILCEASTKWANPFLLSDAFNSRSTSSIPRSRHCTSWIKEEASILVSKVLNLRPPAVLLFYYYDYSFCLFFLFFTEYTIELLNQLRTRSNQESKFDFVATRQRLGKIEEYPNGSSGKKIHS